MSLDTATRSGSVFAERMDAIAAEDMRRFISARLRASSAARDVVSEVILKFREKGVDWRWERYWKSLHKVVYYMYKLDETTCMDESSVIQMAELVMIHNAFRLLLVCPLTHSIRSSTLQVELIYPIGR